MNEKKFSRDFGVYCCPHVFDNSRPILLVIRDPDGDWQFLCGKEDDIGTSPHHVGVGHLLERDPSLEVSVLLEPGSGIERCCENSEWEEFVLDEN